MQDKIISFSLWGSNKLYTQGAIENARIVEEIYPGWKCRFYIDNTVPQHVIKILGELNSDIFLMNKYGGRIEGMFWRFLVCDDKNIERFIVRDCDSRINYREKYAVDEWIKSEMCFHIMRDHYQHNVQILGGMWGATKKAIPDMKKLIDEWQAFGYRGCDQDFLASRIYPRIINDAMIHDEVIGDQYGWKEVGRKAWPKHKPIEWGEHVGGYVFKRVLKW